MPEHLSQTTCSVTSMLNSSLSPHSTPRPWSHPLLPPVNLPPAPQLPISSRLPGLPAQVGLQGIRRPITRRSLLPNTTLELQILARINARQTNRPNRPYHIAGRFEPVPRIPEIIVSLPRRAAPPTAIRARSESSPRPTGRARTGRVFSVLTGRETTVEQTPTEYLEALLAPSDVWD